MRAHPERVLVANLRPADQALEFTRALRERGLDVLEAPALQLEAAYDLREMATVHDALARGGFEWAVFPSANAVRFFQQGLATAGGSMLLLTSCKVLAGSATAEALKDARVSNVRVLTRFSAQAALDDLLSAGGRGPLLVPRAAEGRDELLAGLQAAGVEVAAPVVYRTRPSTPAELAPLVQALANRSVAAIALTSPSTIQALSRAISAKQHDPVAMLEGVSLVCLGETTAAEARAQGLPVAAVAEQTTVAALASAVQAVLAGSGLLQPSLARTEIQA